MNTRAILNKGRDLLILWIFVAHILFLKSHIHKPFHINIHFHTCMNRTIFSSNLEEGRKHYDINAPCKMRKYETHLPWSNLGFAESLLLKLYGQNPLLAHIHFSFCRNFPLPQHFELHGLLWASSPHSSSRPWAASASRLWEQLCLFCTTQDSAGCIEVV